MNREHSSAFRSCVIAATFLAGDVVAFAATEVLDLGGNQYRVTFKHKAPAGTQSVFLAGTFNSWDPQAHFMKGPDGEHVFRISLILGKGRHEYKFVLDGRTWATDPDNPHKTPGYRNAVLLLGIKSAERPLPSTLPTDMAVCVKHPEALNRLVRSLDGKTAVDTTSLVNAWFSGNPMPLFTDNSVSFVYASYRASEVYVQIAGYGTRTGYKMPRLREGLPLFAVSLERAGLPDRTAYTLEVERDGETLRVIDVHAWSLTSRSGRPAALGVEASPKRGRIEVICDLPPSLGDLRRRAIYIYLPPGYEANSQRRYPVLYMHDGQNCWDDPVEPFGHGGWCVNLTADRLINTGEVQPFIAVGVANTPRRMIEYGPGKGVCSGDDHAYIRFLKQGVKPFIDKKYRTLTGAGHTALMGSSMGGVISLQAALLCPETFGMAACLSPAFGFSDESENTYVQLIQTAGKVPVRLYVDNGTGGPGQDGAPVTRRMVSLLRETGWKADEDLTHFEDAGADHNERAWRARLDKPLVFLFGK